MLFILRWLKYFLFNFLLRGTFGFLAALPFGKYYPAVLLVLFNLIPCYGVLFWGWRAGHLIFLYWTENVVVGFYTFLKILALGVFAGKQMKGAAHPILKATLVAFAFGLFFLIHYGAFMYGHFVFLRGFFRLDPLSYWKDTKPAAAWLVASHGYSFLFHFVYGSDYERANAVAAMFTPYKRLVLMHVTIIASGFFVILFSETKFLVLVMAGLKIAADLRAHLEEHRKQEAPS